MKRAGILLSALRGKSFPRGVDANNNASLDLRHFHNGVPYLTPDTSLQEANVFLSTYNVVDVPVLLASSREFVGMFSQRDLARTTVGDILTKSIVTGPPSTGSQHSPTPGSMGQAPAVARAGPIDKKSKGRWYVRLHRARAQHQRAKNAYLVAVSRAKQKKIACSRVEPRPFDESLLDLSDDAAESVSSQVERIFLRNSAVQSDVSSEAPTTRYQLSPTPGSMGQAPADRRSNARVSGDAPPVDRKAAKRISQRKYQVKELYRKIMKNYAAAKYNAKKAGKKFDRKPPKPLNWQLLDLSDNASVPIVEQVKQHFAA